MPLFAIFILVPLIELMILLEVGAIIGSGWTFLIIIATAILGTKLVKQQGTSAWRTIQEKLAQGHLPGQAMFDGICILVSGVLLITPGFMTDILGMLLLTPPFRAVAFKHLGDKIHVVGANRFGGAQFQQSPFEQEQYQRQQSWQDSEANNKGPATLDGEFTRKD